ncbi:hypothetical protein V1478_013439 [Vespula squamosa]|uniref:Uncharacterized protein n=1 Tax=Vespula squamosa TaxID=30214 RepID=A0ABD2AAU9_VESSQ
MQQRVSGRIHEAHDPLGGILDRSLVFSMEYETRFWYSWSCMESKSFTNKTSLPFYQDELEATNVHQYMFDMFWITRKTEMPDRTRQNENYVVVDVSQYRDSIS